MSSKERSPLAPWLYLFTGIFCEIAGTTGMRALLYASPELSQASVTAGIVVSYFLVSRAVEHIPMGLAYAIWSGIGTAGVCLLSFLLFQEPMPAVKIAGIACVIAGMLAINLDKPRGRSRS